MRILLVAIFVTVLLLPTFANAEPAKSDTKEIPLKEIWAYEMPGTRDIKELDVENKRRGGKALLDPISVSFIHRAEAKKWTNLARPAFAVPGSGASALVGASDIFIDNKKPTSVFLSTEDVTLVFFSEPIAGTRVRIRSAYRQKSKVTIQYELEQIIGGGGGRFNLALIPLGKLRAGPYRVEIGQVSTGKPSDSRFYKPMPLDPEWGRNYQCQPFEFRVAEKGA